MSKYEADPAGLGVGKRYGPLNVGGTVGTYRGDGALREIVWEIAASEIVNGKPFQINLPANYRIVEVFYEVEEAFATDSTATVAVVDGGTGVTVPLDVVAPVTLIGTFTNLTPVSSTDDEVIGLTGNAEALASTTGMARVIVRYWAV